MVRFNFLKMQLRTKILTVEFVEHLLYYTNVEHLFL